MPMATVFGILDLGISSMAAKNEVERLPSRTSSRRSRLCWLQIGSESVSCLEMYTTVVSPIIDARQIPSLRPVNPHVGL
jgi:hypothetical protein